MMATQQEMDERTWYVAVNGMLRFAWGITVYDLPDETKSFVANRYSLGDRPPVAVGRLIHELVGGGHD